MSNSVYPANYSLINESNSKSLNLILEIEGAPDYISLQPVQTKIRYGDPIKYGDPGLVYGGLRKIANNKAFLSIDGRMTISQKIEPETGRGSVSTMSFMVTDKDGYMSSLMSPGVVLTEPLGNAKVRVWVGYQNSSFPDDYFVVFRGYITGTKFRAGTVTLQTSDSSSKIRGNVFAQNQNSLSGNINGSVTTIPVFSTANFLQPIVGPNGGYDPAVRFYIQADQEWMEYGAGGVGPTSFYVIRGARNTGASPHSAGATINSAIQIQDNALNVALKLMLSGWNGPFVSGIAVRAINDAMDISVTNNTNCVLIQSATNAIRDLGLVAGDYMIISGSSAGNNGSHIITHIESAGGFPGVLIYTSDTLNLESPATGVTVAFRSQFDTLPDGFGLTPAEVDVATHIKLRKQFFSNDIMQFFFPDAVSGKSFIESQCYQPIGVYSLTRYGQLSCGFTKPPLATETLLQLDTTNIITPDQIEVNRATNNRRYYDTVSYNFDKDDGGNYQSILTIVDQQALTNITIPSVLTVNSDGLKTSLGGAAIVANRARALLNRYKNAAYEISLSTNWKAGSLIETGDTILLSDPAGKLYITNLNDGTRTIGNQLFEAIQRDLNICSGDSKLTLLSNIGASITDRYATVAPSSLVVAGSAPGYAMIQDSFGALFPGAEYLKWTNIIGEQVWVHSPDYTTRSGIITLQGFDPNNLYKMNFVGSLGFTPQVGDVVDLAPYDPARNPKSKLIYCFLDKTAHVVSGSSTTQFTVSAPDAAKLVPGNAILIHSLDYSVLSKEALVDTVIGTTVTMKTSLGITPSAGQLIELIGWTDGGGYRQI